MERIRRQVEESAAAVRAWIGDMPDVAVVLGSGFAAFADRLDQAEPLSCRSIPHWPVPGVSGHAGVLALGVVKGCRVLGLSGRGHLYEGHDAQALGLPVRVLAYLGARRLILTNAAGGINPDLSPGSLMVIDDHINLTGANPLVGPHDEWLGPRFPDMSEVYSARLRRLAVNSARTAKVPVASGVYVAVSGPSYETPAEIRAFRRLGADAVGMSTVHEAITARHAGLEVLGISCIANGAAGVAPGLLDEGDVNRTVAAAAGRFAALMDVLIPRMASLPDATDD